MCLLILSVSLSTVGRLGWGRVMIRVSCRDIEGCRGLQRVTEGTDRTVGMTMISGINQLGPQKLKFQVS